MVYGVNNTEFGINEILQLIELTLGEGEFLKYYMYQMFCLYFRIIFSLFNKNILF